MASRAPQSVRAAAQAVASSPSPASARPSPLPRPGSRPAARPGRTADAPPTPLKLPTRSLRPTPQRPTALTTPEPPQPIAGLAANVPEEHELRANEIGGSHRLIDRMREKLPPWLFDFLTTFVDLENQYLRDPPKPTSYPSRVTLDVYRMPPVVWSGQYAWWKKWSLPETARYWEERMRRVGYHPVRVWHTPGVLRPPTKDRTILFEIADRISFRAYWPEGSLWKAMESKFDKSQKLAHTVAGKFWLAPPKLFKPHVAKYFPDVYARDPQGMFKHSSDVLKGKISLVVVYRTAMGPADAYGFAHQQMRHWLNLSKDNVADRPEFTNHLSNPNFQVVQLTHMSAYLRWMRVYEWWLADPARLANGKEVVHLTSWEHIRRMNFAELHNVCWIYVVDAKQRIRWCACSFARPEELENMGEAITTLLHRLDMGKE